MMAHARGDGRRQNPCNIRAVGPLGDSAPIWREASVTDGDDAKVLPLDRSRAERRTAAPPPPTTPPRLESDESSPKPPESDPPPPKRHEETLAERLDHALDGIRRMMIADRTKGPY